MASIENGILKASNAELLNTVREYAPNDYQQRVPAVTQGDAQQAIMALNNYTPDWNIAMNILVNKFAPAIFHAKSFSNPLKGFKRNAIQYGNTIEEMQVNLLKAKSFETEAMNIFGRRDPDVHVHYHTDSRKDKYAVTIPMADMMRGAFNEGTSLAALLSSCTAQLNNSNENDEYLMTVDLLRKYEQFYGFYNWHIADPVAASQADQAAAARTFVKGLRQVIKNWKFYSCDYSWEGRTNGLFTKADQPILIVDSALDAILDVEMYAYMFNEKFATIDDMGKIVVIPEIPIPDCHALLVDADWFIIADQLNLTLTAPMNPENLTQNHFMHVWQLFSFSLMCNAVKFTPDAQTVIDTAVVAPTGVEVEDAQGQTSTEIDVTFGERGTTDNILIPLQASVTPAGANQAVMWTISAYDGAGQQQALPTTVYVDSEGILHIAEGTPEFSTIVVKATSTVDMVQYGEYTVTVSGGIYGPK